MRLWDPNSGTIVRSWAAHDNDVGSLSFSPDGKWLATTGENGGAVWEVASGQLVRRLDIGAGKVMALVFTPDGQTLVVGGAQPFIEPLDLANWSARKVDRQ